MPDEGVTRERRVSTISHRVYARFAVAGIAVAAAMTPDDTLWHRAVMPAAIGLVTVDWLWNAWRSHEAMPVAFGAYGVFLVTGMLFRHTFETPKWALVVVTTGMALCLVAGLGFVVRDRRRRKELDRLIFSEASSLAFFTLMGVTITYGFAESWLELAPPSPWLFAAAGAVAFVGARVAVGRKYF